MSTLTEERTATALDLAAELQSLTGTGYSATNNPAWVPPSQRKISSRPPATAPAPRARASHNRPLVTSLAILGPSTPAPAPAVIDVRDAAPAPAPVSREAIRVEGMEWLHALTVRS